MQNATYEKDLSKLDQRVQLWNSKKVQSHGDGMNEHQRIIQESKYLDRASDCSAEIADEVQNEDDDTFFKSESYQEIYKSSVNSNQEKIKIVFNSCQHKQIVEEK